MKDYIRSRHDRMTHLIKTTQAALSELQSQCHHETAVFSAHGSTGNWDNESSYWYTHYCYDCGRRWTTEQTTEARGASRKVDEIDYEATPEEEDLARMLAAARGKRT